MRHLLLLLAIAGCGHKATPATKIDDTLGNEAVQADRVFLDATELLTKGPGSDTPHARIARYGTAWVDLDRAGVKQTEPDDPDHDVVPVSETRGLRVRVRADSWEAAYVMIWINRADLETVIAHGTGVAAGPNEAYATEDGVGVWLRPGTPLVEVHDAGTRRGITVDTDRVQVNGEIDPAALGDLWIEPAAAGDAPRSIDAGVDLHARPGDEAAVIASITGFQGVRELERGSGWALIETLGPHVIARGYVSEELVGGETRGRIRVQDWGASNGRDTIEVPAGACIYDGKGGAPIGVGRAAYHQVQRDLGDGWHWIGVHTSWGELDGAVHVTAPGTFASCAVSGP